MIQQSAIAHRSHHWTVAPVAHLLQWGGTFVHFVSANKKRPKRPGSAVAFVTVHVDWAYGRNVNGRLNSWSGAYSGVEKTAHTCRQTYNQTEDKHTDTVIHRPRGEATQSCPHRFTRTDLHTIVHRHGHTDTRRHAHQEDSQYTWNKDWKTNLPQDGTQLWGTALHKTPT